MNAVFQTNTVLSSLAMFAVSNMLSITAVMADLAFQLFLFLTLIYLLVDKERGVIDLTI